MLSSGEKIESRINTNVKLDKSGWSKNAAFVHAMNSALGPEIFLVGLHVIEVLPQFVGEDFNHHPL